MKTYNWDGETIKDDGTVEFNFIVEWPRVRDGTFIGERLSLYIPKVRKPDRIFVYYKNGPGGPLGFFPEEKYDLFDRIVDHLKANKDHESMIVQDKGACEVHTKLFPWKRPKGRRPTDLRNKVRELMDSYFSPVRPADSSG